MKACTIVLYPDRCMMQASPSTCNISNNKILPPMENDIIELLKTNKIQKGKTYYLITINKPRDFIYDISDIVLKYDPDTKSKTINCIEIPEHIKENIYKFDFLSLKEYVRLLEDNLDVFLKGEVPRVEYPEQEILKSGELPKSFKFPRNSLTTANLKCDIFRSNILLLCCLRVSIVVQCTKCNRTLNLDSNEKCPKCKMGLGLTYVPIIDSESLGYLQLRKCDLVCFNPMKYQFSCSECHKAYESRELSIGETYTQKCYECFTELKIRVNRIEYYQKKDVEITEGTELPNKGTCKHYKKSFRWFRFGCCNSVYPCDVCHDEQSGHKSQVANRMVCGLCSKEQSIKKECDCGMSIVEKHTGFWEGGKGNRNKATLSKKDSRKYS